MRATIKLTVLNGDLQGREFVFGERSRCAVGRADDCGVRLPGHGVFRAVSRHHCLLDINPPGVRVRDSGSRNGTYVNGFKIGQRALHQAPMMGMALSALLGEGHDLKDGDVLGVGGTLFRVNVSLPPGSAERN